MRLLLRANAHRPVAAGCREVAASPDTPERERWQWHVRLLEGPRRPWPSPSPAPPSAAHRTTGELPGGLVVEAAADARTVASAVEVLAPGAAATVDREEGEVVVLVAAGGHVLVEGRHLLGHADSMVFEGDDPVRVPVRRADGSEARVAVVRLSAVGERTLSWVP